MRETTLQRCRQTETSPSKSPQFACGTGFSLCSGHSCPPCPHTRNRPSSTRSFSLYTQKYLSTLKSNSKRKQQVEIQPPLLPLSPDYQQVKPLVKHPLSSKAAPGPGPAPLQRKGPGFGAVHNGPCKPCQEAPASLGNCCSGSNNTV